VLADGMFRSHAGQLDLRNGIPAFVTVNDETVFEWPLKEGDPADDETDVGHDRQADANAEIVGSIAERNRKAQVPEGGTNGRTATAATDLKSLQTR
jgi:hypothetical protein